MNMEKGVKFYQFPDFFKVYIPRSSSRRMKLPPDFGKRIPEGPIPRNVFLRDRRGKRFSVELSSRGDNLFFEGDGWVQFVRDKSLVEFHILVFIFDGTDTYDFTIFEGNGCKKIDEDGEEVSTEVAEIGAEVVAIEAEVAAVGAVEEINETEEANDEGDGEEAEKEEKLVGRKRGKGKAKERNNIDIYGDKIFKSGAYTQPVKPYFVTRVRQDRKDMVYIPSDVVKVLKYELGETLNVRDPRGRSYTLKRKAWSDGRRWYIDGWRRLCKYNLVDEKASLICELIEMDEEKSVEMQITNIIRAENLQTDPQSEKSTSIDVLNMLM